MTVLKFKILVDELDDVHRILEIKSGQNFKEFHEGILGFFDLRSKKPASFFVSNQRWQKLNEITLGSESTFDNAIDGLKNAIGTVVSEETSRLVYFNEGLPQFTFLVEFDETIAANGSTKDIYPRCVKTVGNLPSMGTTFTDDIFEDNVKLHIDNIVEEPEDDDFF